MQIRCDMCGLEVDPEKPETYVDHLGGGGCPGGTAMFQCERCPEFFIGKEADVKKCYEMHVACECVNRRCPHCSDSYSFCRQHWTRCSALYVECDWCHDKFPTPGQLLQHMLACTKRPCPICKMHVSEYDIYHHDSHPLCHDSYKSHVSLYCEARGPKEALTAARPIRDDGQILLLQAALVKAIASETESSELKRLREHLTSICRRADAFECNTELLGEEFNVLVHAAYRGEWTDPKAVAIARRLAGQMVSFDDLVECRGCKAVVHKDLIQRHQRQHRVLLGYDYRLKHEIDDAIRVIGEVFYAPGALFCHLASKRFAAEANAKGRHRG